VTEVAVLLYITLSAKNLRRVGLGIVLFALITMLVCIWALCAKNSMESKVDKIVLSDCDIIEEPVENNTVTASDFRSTLKDSSGEPNTPVNAGIYPFAITQNIGLPLENAFISSGFGYRDHPINGNYSFHSGLDLAAPEGTPISAMLDGEVTTAGFASDYGNYIIIDHGEFQTLYAHCLTLCAEAGDIVTKGQKIAEVGSTGTATGSHVHIEIRCNGQRYDPADLLGDSYT